MPTSDTLFFGPFRLVISERLLLKNGAPVVIGDRALDILISLVCCAGRTLTHRELTALVWPHLIVEDSNLRVHVAGLRKVLGDGIDGIRYIVNVTGRGYCFVAPVRNHPQEGLSRSGGAHIQKATQIPAALSRMVGRAASIQAVSNVLMSRRFVSIVGPGGMGKTTVAIAVAHALFEQFDGAVYFIDLGALTDPSLIAGTVAATLGTYSSGEDTLSSVLAFLGDRKVCIILDSCEHLVDATAALSARLFSAAPNLYILTTSREALRVTGENVHLLPPLDGPHEGADLTVAEALASPAAQLFLERAAASGYGAELSEVEVGLVADICRRLDGIALAIEIAASRVGAYGVAGTAKMLDGPFKLLWNGCRNAVPRHQTLAAMLDWSYNLLSDTEQRVLCRLSVFRGAFDLEAAVAVSDEVGSIAGECATAVAGLADRSLVSITSIRGSTYYRLLDTTRAFAESKLHQQQDADTIKRRHAIYVSNLLAALETPQIADFGGYSASALELHLGNVRAAVEWSFSPEGDADVALKLVVYAAPLLLGLSLLSECRAWCRRALAAAPQHSDNLGHELALRKVLSIASMYTLGNTPEVRTEIERGLELADAQGDSEHQLHFLAGLNLFLVRRGNFRVALTVAERYADVAKDVGPAGEVCAEWMLGQTYHMLGNQAEARRRIERGFALQAASPAVHVNYFAYDHRVRAEVALARTLWLAGLPDQAVDAARVALDQIDRCDHPVTRCVSLLWATYVFLWCGAFDVAANVLGRATDHAKRHALPVYQDVAAAMRGELMVLSGAVEDGIDFLQSSIPSMIADDHHVVVSAASRAWAEGLVRCGRHEEAKPLIARAVERAQAFGGTFDLPELLRVQGVVLLADPAMEPTLPEAALIHSLELARSQAARGWELRTATTLARMWSEQGEVDKARSLLLPIQRRFTEGFGSQDLRTATALLESLLPAQETPGTPSELSSNSKVAWAQNAPRQKQRRP
ncbi:ATP-binding protein [Pararhizobium sp. DWP3-4]|uniref:ATP-binding protein n=1 Tax=Pararhizobium sp. DWP3-4 TaxID=2804565 RepID=UPI003CF41141